jgi:hypothetical protein
VIEIPKLKTHKKVGVTLNMKLLVGMCGNKNSVAHYRWGTPVAGGDQFADSGPRERMEFGALYAFKSLFPWLGPVRRVIARPMRKIGEAAFGRTDHVVRSGNWFGNDTAWRMTHDLLRILMYADHEGRLHTSRTRRLFSIVDGIIGGEGDGPLDATPKPVGAVVAGPDPVAVDAVGARLMGFDPSRLVMLARATEEHDLPLASFEIDDLQVISNRPAYSRRLGDWTGPAEGFAPHFGWRACPGLLVARTSDTTRSDAQLLETVRRG